MLDIGFYDRLCERDGVLGDALALGERLAAGPTFAHATTKTMLDKGWNIGLDEAIEAEV